jgi:sugar/nucleoside kinase (ribokinase family)/biotin operon repressor
MRLTSREKEIAEVLKKEPLISQDDLAQRLDITRSSVAVHISNLMKKGILLGKGYVFNQQVSMVVIGESCVNISIKTEEEQHSVDIKDGGFAISVSEALSRFGIYVKLISVIGNDDIGTRLLTRLQAHNIDTSNIYYHSNKRTCRVVSVDDVFAYREGYSYEEYAKAIEAKNWVAFNCDWLIVEDQFQKLIYKLMLTKDESIPRFCTCKYINSPQDIPDYLSYFDLVVIGLDSFKLVEDYINRSTHMIQRSDQHFIFTDGKTGITCVNNAGVSDYTLLPNQNFSVRDRLSFLLAGVIYGLSSGYPLRQAFRIGAGTASTN